MQAPAAFCAAVVLAGCNAVGGLVVGGHIAGEASVDRSTSFAAVSEKLPPLADGHIRLYVYRPQVFGGYPRPIAVVDGSFIGLVERGVARSTRLSHRSVFVVDMPSRPVDVWLYTIEETLHQDMERKIAVSPQDGQVLFLRIALGSTYHFFERVAESEAMKDIRDLTFTGYVRLR